MVVNQIDPESHIVAAIGLPLLFENKVWVVHSITDSRVVLKHGQARRIVFYGDYVVTEGLQRGFLASKRPGFSTDLSLLMYDRIRRATFDAANERDVLDDQRTCSALLRIQSDGISEIQEIMDLLSHLKSARRVAYAIKGLLSTDIHDLEFPTPTKELIRLSKSGEIDWIGIGWGDILRRKWIKLGLNSNQARKAKLSGFNPLTLMNWLDEFVERECSSADFELILKWGPTGIDPGKCFEFIDQGLDQMAANLAIQNQLDIDAARMWTDAGVPFHLANGWIKAGFNPAEGIEWINAGLGQADVANTWKELGLGVSEYLDWRKVTTSPSIVEICILNSIEPQEFIDWKANGFEDISEILRWKSSNLSPNAASFFIRNSVELEVAITWVGLAPGQLSFFNGEASEWVKSNFKHDEAKSWHKIPVPIRIAEEWRKSGLKAEDYLQFDSSTIEFYLTPSQRLAWALGGVSIQDVASWCRIGITDFPNARYLMKSGNTVESLIQENAKAARIAEEKRQRSKEKRLANREKQLKESNRINRENAKAARIAEEKRQRSKEKRLANRSLSGNKPFQVKLSNHHLSKYSTIEWLEEVQAKAELLKGMISKTNQWPIEFYFSDHELLVAVFVEGDVVTGTLMSGEAQISVIFNFSTFAPVQRISTAIQRLAFGLTLSLLIDSTIVLKKSSERSSRLFRLYTKTERVDCAIQTRYLPTESFQAGIQEIRQGHGVPKALHQVVGHIRTFQNGQKPSAEARGNAPIFLKRRLSSNQTYVAPHSRGSIERVAEYNKQLSRFSALAHAIAYLE